MTCPWCEENALLDLRELREDRAAFSCIDCGTTVELAEDELDLERAA